MLVQKLEIDDGSEHMPGKIGQMVEIEETPAIYPEVFNLLFGNVISALYNFCLESLIGKCNLYFPIFSIQFFVRCIRCIVTGLFTMVSDLYHFNSEHFI